MKIVNIYAVFPDKSDTTKMDVKPVGQTLLDEREKPQMCSHCKDGHLYYHWTEKIIYCTKCNYSQATKGK